MKKLVSAAVLVASIAGALGMSLSLQAEAQTPLLLRGLSQIKLSVEFLDQDSKDCGLTKELVRDAVRYPASSAKFQVVDDTSAPAALYVNASSLFFRSEELCVTHISVEAYSIQELTLDFSDRKVLLEVELWNKGSIISSDRSKYPHHVTEVIEGLAKQFVTDWNLDNKDGN